MALASYPGCGEGEGGMVPIACACAKNFVNFPKILRDINGVHVVVHSKRARVRKKYPVFKCAGKPGAEAWLPCRILLCTYVEYATRRRRMSIVAGCLGMKKNLALTSRIQAW